MADEPQRHRIEVACPECGHLQIEPALVVSTQCRSCRANFQVKDGKGVIRSLPVTRLAKPRKDSDPEPPPPATAYSKTPLRLAPVEPPPRSLLLRLLHPAKPARDVICFNCSHTFSAIAEAQSSQCPKCGGYVNLLDHDITDHSNARIKTRGNVIIRKTGSISGVTVRCHHLTVLGGLSASVECSGDVIIRSHGKITGTIACRHLRVEKGARVEFLNPVTATTATIDGHVRGQISCTGSVTLEKRAQLHGLVRTSELIIKAGAKHTGTMEMMAAPQI
ncbi:MAG: polymer-forming cytoskeletal protein [Luteolibacter sp.]|jgi:cytoskeletal protein CcmA (bactofilin family)/DNA-directed RNA polymerase subunit RPC12/RpoP|nr:polymer-forming cytoskeletal protein [Luteolibacter sp.]